MKSAPAFAALALCQLSTFVPAQKLTPATALQDPTIRSFAVVLASKVLTVEGDWKQSTQLREYANAHTGTYIVFGTATGFSILRKPDEISKVLTLYKEVARLGKKQELLEAKQAPLAKRQDELGSDMKKASSPEEMRRIGEEQSKVGLEQGALGREQGRIGQEQGTAGRNFYDSVITFLKACVADRSCPEAYFVSPQAQIQWPAPECLLIASKGNNILG